jgi:hypothetical protein
MTNQSYNLMCPDAFTNTKIDQMEDLMNKRGVDLVLFGHDHTYGRTHPVSFHKAIQTGNSYDTPGAPIYFDLGTGGSSGTFPNCRKDPWVAVCRAPIETSGFGRFVVSPTTVRYDFLENSAGIVDSFTLTKRPATDYVVSVDPASAILTPGAMTTANVSILGASSNPVALSVTGCPSGTTCTFNPTSGNPSFASTFRVQTSPSSPNGNFDLVIAGKNATQSRTVTFHLTIGSHVIVSFRRGDGGAFSQVNDTHIYDTTPNANFGTAAKLLVDGDKCINQAGVCKTLIKFPSIIGPSTGQIPAGSTIVNATLELTIVNTGDPMDVYQVTEAWTELGATWNSFATPGIPGNRGKEFSVTPSVLGKFSISITKIAQRWANGDVNQGLLLASALADGSDYASSESTGSPRPLLRVEFVPPPPSFDFSVSVSPSSGYVLPGGSVSATAAATLVSSATRNVQLSCANLPSGAICTFTPPSCNPSCTANLVLATSSSTPGGTYSVGVQATNGTITRSSTFTLTVGGLVLSYDMQNLTADGRLKDLSGNANHGTMTGTTDVAGKIGRARAFNGTTDYISSSFVPAPFGMPGTPASIVLWSNQTTTAQTRGKSIAYTSLIYQHPTNNFVYFSNTNDYFAVASVLTPGVFHQLVLRWTNSSDDLTATLFIDGVQFPVVQQTGPHQLDHRALVIGWAGYTSYYPGIIDEVHIYNRALNDSEVAALTPARLPHVGPVLSYDMETLLPDGRLKDLSGNGNHGTMTGTTDVTGKVGRARAFNGTTDYISSSFVPAPFGMPGTPGSIVLWSNQTTSAQTRGTGIAYTSFIYQHPANNFVYLSNTNDYFAVASELTPGVFHHLVLRWTNSSDDLTATLFVDGVRFSVNRQTGPHHLDHGALVIGRAGYTYYYYPGIIDEVRVYDRALNDSEVTAIAAPDIVQRQAQGSMDHLPINSPSPNSAGYRSSESTSPQRLIVTFSSNSSLSAGRPVKIDSTPSKAGVPLASVAPRLVTRTRQERWKTCGESSVR